MTPATASENQTFTLTDEIHVRATLEQTFNSPLAQIGRLNEAPNGSPMPMVIEPRPGGRWYRDLGGDNGHLWGFVQSIKRPVLLEMTRSWPCWRTTRISWRRARRFRSGVPADSRDVIGQASGSEGQTTGDGPYRPGLVSCANPSALRSRNTGVRGGSFAGSRNSTSNM